MICGFVKVNTRRVALCFLTGVAFAAICLSYNLWQNGLVFIGLAILLMPSEIDLGNSSILKAIWYIIVATISFLLIQLTVNASVRAVGMLRITYNVVAIIMLYLIAYSVCGKEKASIIGVTTVLIAIATIDYYIVRFRGRELSPADILSIRTAINVSEGFNYTPGLTLVSSWIQFMEFIVVNAGIRFQSYASGIKQRTMAFGTAILCFLVVFAGIGEVTPHHFGTSGAGINGFIINFLAQTRSIIVEIPNGYDENNVLLIEQKYLKNEENSGHKPDIIVIMDESFADLKILGAEIQTNREVMPFLDSLEENTVRGFALSSVFGGNTANSEYEFLTGNTMLFLPDDSVPYQQFIKENRYSLAWYLKGKGYYTLAMHPFFSSGWMRTSAYPYLGFDEYEFIEAFPQKDLIRGFVSDSEMIQHLILRYNELVLDNRPVFIFGITMQNHGGYEYTGEDFTNTIELIGYEKEYPKAEQYLSLIYESDKALEQLISYFSSIEREVVVVFFGDHLPSLEEDFFREIHGGAFSGPDEEILKYKVPFIIWANYDIQEEKDIDTSINYLAAKAFQATGIEINAYQRFLLKASSVIPEVNAFGFRSMSQKRFLNKTEDTSARNAEENDLLKEYSYLQYNNMFGETLNNTFYQFY